MRDRDFLTQTHPQDPKNKVEVRQAPRKGLPAGLGDSPVEDGAGSLDADAERRHIRQLNPHACVAAAGRAGSVSGPSLSLISARPGPAQ